MGLIVKKNSYNFTIKLILKFKVFLNIFSDKTSVKCKLSLSRNLFFLLSISSILYSSLLFSSFIFSSLLFFFSFFFSYLFSSLPLALISLFTFLAWRPNWNVLRLCSIIRHLIIWHLIFWCFCISLSFFNTFIKTKTRKISWFFFLEKDWIMTI